LGSVEEEIVMDKEKRTYARRTLHARALLHKRGSIVVGEVVDLSMNGAYVTSAVQMEVGDMVTVTIFHTLTPQILRDLKAKVVRVTDLGMGLQFDKLLID
jgi:exosome complex RNA-binding protein Csl4